MHDSLEDTQVWIPFQDTLSDIDSGNYADPVTSKRMKDEKGVPNPNLCPPQLAGVHHVELKEHDI